VSRGGSFEEGSLRFHFEDSCRVIKYDDTRTYLEGIQTLRDSKGVDFIAELSGPGGRKDIYFIEVKDFRGYRIQNKKRLSNGALAEEVAAKVRDSIAGLVGAQRRALDEASDDWSALMHALAPMRTVQVVLWLEEDTPRHNMRHSNRASTLQEAIKRHLSWLDARVLVQSSASTRMPPGVTVEFLPRSPS